MNLDSYQLIDIGILSSYPTLKFAYFPSTANTATSSMAAPVMSMTTIVASVFVTTNEIVVIARGFW